MIANLTIIVAAYVFVRLANLAVRQYPSAERSSIARAAFAGVSVLAMVVVVLCLLDTLGTGVHIGTAVEESRHRH